MVSPVPDGAQRREGPARPRLLYILTRPLFAQRVLRGQLAYFRQHGYDVHLATSPGPELLAIAQQEQVSVHPIRIARDVSPVSDALALFRLVRLCRRLRPDIVNAGMPKSALLGLVAARLTGVPVRVYILRGLRLETARGLERRVLAMCERVTSDCAHRVVSVSQSLRTVYLAQGYTRADKITVLGHGSSNGVEAEQFERGASDEKMVSQLRRTLAIDADQPVVGFAGRLTQDKGLVDLHEAFLRVRERVPGARLLLVGDCEMGRRRLPEKTRNALATDPGVILAGVVPDPAPYYGLMDVVVIASHREGFPNLPLEAGACGLPVVGVRATGTIDAIDDGRTGVLVDMGDIRGLADGIVRYLEDEDLRREHGAAAQQRVCESFRGPIIWRALGKVYRELVAGVPDTSAGRGRGPSCVG